MQPTRRRVLKAGLAATAVGLAGCAGSDEGGDSSPTATSTPTPAGDNEPDDESAEARPDAPLNAETAVAARWNVLRARIWDAVALGRADMHDAGARAAEDLFEDFEAMGGEYGAHEMLEEADEEAYGTFEGELSELSGALSEGSLDDAAGAARSADGALRDAQASLTTGRVAQALTLQSLGARAATAELLAAAGSTAAAGDVASAVTDAFEDAPVHDTVEEADERAYERFETALGDVESAAGSDDAEGVTTAARDTLSAAVDGSYEVISPDGIAGVGHLAAMGARGHDAAVLYSLGGPSTSFAHAAGLTIYRARAHDAGWLADRGAGDTAGAMASDIFAHFEGARAHEALEDADEEAYEGFESGLESLSTAIENGDGSGTDDAVASVDSNLVAGIEALATDRQAAVLQAGFFRARLADARTLYDLGHSAAAGSVAQSVFERFERDELGFHETLEETDESLYERFEETHLGALIDALNAEDDSAVDTHYRGAQQALLDFEARHDEAVASPAEAAYLTGRAFDAAGLAALGNGDGAATVVSDAFDHFEAGAAGFHEAVEDADHETYETFEERLGAVRTAATDGGDVYSAATTFNDSGIAAIYAVVGAAGGTYADGAADIVSDVFATFENAAVHEQLEEGDHTTYESFEAALDAYQSALADGGDVPGAAGGFDRATTRALFAVAGAVDDSPVEIEGERDEAERDFSGGPNVVEGVPEDADHVVDMEAVAYAPAELTVSAGDTVAFVHAAGEPHTVTAYEDAIPDSAGYWASGGFESEQAAREGWENGEGAVQSGQSYVHTFETVGTHEYVCLPHESAGMEGRILVE